MDYVVDQVMDFRSDFPEIASMVAALALMGVIYLGKKLLFKGEMSEGGKSVASLLGDLSKWRWGLTKKSHKPTGNSIIFDGNVNGFRKKMIANFKKGKYILDGVEVQLTKTDKKELAKLRNVVVTHLLNVDLAKKTRETSRQQAAQIAKLNNLV